MLDCYRNFGRDNNVDEESCTNNMEQEDEIVSITVSNEYKLLGQVDLMWSPDRAPASMEGVPTSPLRVLEPPSFLSVSLSDWTVFALPVSELSNQLLHHRSGQLGCVYFGVLFLFILLLTAVKIQFESSVMEAIGIVACLAGILIFVVAFNRLPVWHDASLDDKIHDFTTRQPLQGYILIYNCSNASEGMMGMIRRIQIYQKQAVYQQPVLK